MSAKGFVTKHISVLVLILGLRWRQGNEHVFVMVESEMTIGVQRGNHEGLYCPVTVLLRAQLGCVLYYVSLFIYRLGILISSNKVIVNLRLGTGLSASFPVFQAYFKF